MEIKVVRRRPALFIDPPKMAHGDAKRMADFSEEIGLPPVPWQKDFLERIEAASMDKQFNEIVKAQTK